MATYIVWNMVYVYPEASKTHMKLMPTDFERCSKGNAYIELGSGSLLRILGERFYVKESVTDKPIPDLNRRVLANLVRTLAEMKRGISFILSLSEAEIILSKQSYETAGTHM